MVRSSSCRMDIVRVLDTASCQSLAMGRCRMSSWTLDTTLLSAKRRRLIHSNRARSFSRRVTSSFSRISLQASITSAWQ